MYYFIVNPHSGGGGGFRAWQKIERILAARSVEYEAYLTEAPGQARSYASALTANRTGTDKHKDSEKEMILVVVGGDGTFSEVLDGLDLDRELALGYIPVGVGNDLAKSLRLSGWLPARLRSILSGSRFRYLDYGVITYCRGECQEAGHRRFIVSTGMGLDAAICYGEDSLPIKPLLGRFRMNRLNAHFARHRACRQARPTSGYIILDGAKRVEFNNLYFVSAQLQPYECGGLRVAPRAGRGDGSMVVCVLSHSSRRELMPILARAGRGRRNIRGLRSYECRQVEIHMESPRLSHADGESSGMQISDIEAVCMEKKIKMIL